MSVQLKGTTMNIDARYEKLPLTCFLCEMIDHVDDMAKPYGRWFQDDVKRFGLDSDGGWVMKAPLSDELDDPMHEAAEEPMLCGENGQEGNHIPDLNEVFNDNDRLPLFLFGIEITPKVGDDVSAQEVKEVFTGNLALSLLRDGFREMLRREGSFVRDDSSLSLGV
ncbi:glucan endo-1,3-beta-glucosidase [Pyrus ussuriensis x Pyrus communis]|uniref:Glucan endo-1,3-beta-glucosidase n=1 Tax=Pyrus ussuriensis x Pyrus communis TaxID=2448454 RepID=A0A5N5G7V5_9ROSA|nr:glucan endo-1,3-beta-glucosidase [Pyrus ussuriensis x Pyrus communis]